MEENSHFDKKSLKIVSGSTADWAELAKDCVCFANGVGGVIYIGIEDENDEPDSTQKIKASTVDKINKTIPQRTINVGITTSKVTHKNG